MPAATRWMSVGIDLDPGPLAPRAARAFLRGVLAVWDCDDRDSMAELLTSEVVTDAVRDGIGEVKLRLILRDGVLRVEAHHDGCRTSSAAAPGGEAAVGRELFLDQLARDWGAGPDADGHGGKVVWFEVPVTAGPCPKSVPTTAAQVPLDR